MIKKITGCLILIFLILIFIHEWSLADDLYVPVVCNNLNLRVSPNNKSKIIMQLPILTKLKVIKTLDDKINLDNKIGCWAYVDTPFLCDDRSNETVKGWVFDYYLGYLTKFTRITKFKKDVFGYCDGEYCPEYIISEDGTFIYSYELCKYSECNTEQMQKCYLKGELLKGKMCSGKGYLFKYESVYWLRKNNENSSLFVYQNKAGKFCTHPTECD